MNQQPNNFDFDESNNGFKVPQVETTIHQNNEGISTESLLARKKQLKRLVMMLMGIGLIMGLLLSVGVVILLNKLGLTKKPSDLQQQKQQPVEQIRYHHSR